MPADPNIIEERLVVVAEAYAAHIEAAPYLTGVVPVFTERKGDINQMISLALGKLGICITVVAADAGETVRKGDKLQIKARLVAHISEHYLINNGVSGSKKPALAAVIAVMKAVDRKLNGLQPPDELPVAGLYEFELQMDLPFRLVPDKSYITYQVTAYTTVLL